MTANGKRSHLTPRPETTATHHQRDEERRRKQGRRERRDRTRDRYVGVVRVHVREGCICRVSPASSQSAVQEQPSGDKLNNGRHERQSMRRQQAAPEQNKVEQRVRQGKKSDKPEDPQENGTLSRARPVIGERREAVRAGSLMIRE